MLPYIARRAEDKREQALSEHLHGTAERAAEFASVFAAAEWGYLCGLLHDIGKYSKAFQDRVRGANQRVDHATAGSRELIRKGALSAAFCVAGHHGGLPDGGDQMDSADQITLVGRSKRDLEDYAAWKTEITPPSFPKLKSEHSDPLQESFFTRMLYSCLVDADYLDTEAFMSDGTVDRAGGESMSVLLGRLNDHFEKKGFLKPNNDLNGRRTQVLKDCIEIATTAPGLFSLTVPTGGGKTLASLAFALNHAVSYGKTRIIYVIPYCSIIDQTAEIFRDILGADNVLEHHSSATYETDEHAHDEAKNKMVLATENWDVPIVVTTSVQFFESLYANRSSRCRKLHNIANSVVIFDEAQMIPVPCLKPCVLAIAQLVEHFKTTAVLCTATQPSLDGLFSELAPQLERREICTEPQELYMALRRVRFQQIGKLSNAELANRLSGHEQVLCIVNSRKQAQEVFGLLQGEGNYHLSTLMYPQHRSRLLEGIRKRLKEGVPCRVVSTSLIEAGVDVDFPAVYRAEAGLDSILQAAGRCNREGRRGAEESIVTIFQPEAKSPLLLGANISAMREAERSNQDIGAFETIQIYFNALLQFKGDGALDKYGVLDAFRRGIHGRLLPFRTVAERFRMIESTAKTIYIPEGAGVALVEKLCAGQVSRGLFRALGRYGVTVYPEQFDALYRAGDIEKISGDAAILLNMGLYRSQTGLSLEAEEGKGFLV